MKKSFAFGMLLASGMLVACGGATSSASQAASSQSEVVSSASEAPSVVSSQEEVSTQEEVVQKYEILGSYDELYDQFAAFEFYGALYSDGTGTLVQATLTSKGDNANKASLSEEISFKYKVEDDDGIETLIASINGARVNAYKDNEGNFSFKYSFTFAGSYSREATLYVSENIAYEDATEWVEAIEDVYSSREVEVVINDSFVGDVYLAGTEDAYTVNMQGYDLPVTAQVDLLSDMTVKAAFGYNHGGNYVGGEKDIPGSWTVDTSTMEYVITIGTEVYNVATSGEGSSFVWNFTHEIKDEGGLVIDTKNLTATMVLVAKDA